MPTLFVAAFGLLVGGVVLRCLYLRWFHPLAVYPGPLLASLTDHWRFFTFLGGKHHLIEQSLHQRHGDIVRTGPTTLSFATLPAFEAIYSYNKGIEKGDHYGFTRPEQKSTNVFSEPFSVDNRPRRRILTDAALSSNHVVSYNPIIVKHATELQQRVAKQLSLANNVNIAPLVHRYTFDTMIDLVFGPSISPSPYTSLPEAQHVLEDYRVAGKMTWAAGMLPWLRWFMAIPTMRPSTRRPKYDTHGNLIGRGALATNSRQLIFEQPQAVKTTEQPSIVRNLMLSGSDKTNLYSDPAQVLGESMNMTFAGPGSTAAAITTVLHQLGTGQGKEWQDRIRAEMNDKRANYSLTLRSVVKETLRLHAPFPSAFPRTIMPGGESTIPGIVAPLPTGTTVYAHTWVLGRSKEIWGPDAEEWKPARWIAASDTTSKEMSTDETGLKEGEQARLSAELDRKFVVFGKGPRQCIGKDIAVRVVENAVCEILGKWEVQSVSELKGKSWLEMQYDECWIELRERGR